jgi:predicted DNA repair protein MutK
MSSGLIALLDDMAALAKAAAASIDDVAAQAGKAGTKAAGVVIDDAAVTPRYVAGLAPSRELPMIGRIALGSLRNKLVFLLPVALALGLFAPWAITPLLMLGGAYLCFEGAEKVVEAAVPHPAPAQELPAATPAAEEEAKVAGAIRTDFILSAEIMAVTLASVPAEGFWVQAAVLATVGIGITLAVYGAVAVLVKLDDAGVALAARGGPFLFGEQRTMADAMYAPVVTRFMTYDVKLDPVCTAYAKRIMAMPEMQEWITAARKVSQPVL